MQTREQKLKLLNKTIETLWHGVSDTKEGDISKNHQPLQRSAKAEPKRQRCLGKYGLAYVVYGY